MNLRQEFLAILDALARARLDYAICGGFAVGLHGYPRLTSDIDLLVRPADLDQVRQALAALGYTLDSGSITFAAGKTTEHGLWRVSRAEGGDLITVDLLLVSPFLSRPWAATTGCMSAQRRPEGPKAALFLGLPVPLGRGEFERAWRITRAADFARLARIRGTCSLEDVWASREVFQLGERRVQVVSRSGLLKMKRAAGRRKDLDDIEKLRLEGDARPPDARP